jgi:osmotically-inducible protein OsmY
MKRIQVFALLTLVGAVAGCTTHRQPTYTTTTTPVYRHDPISQPRYQPVPVYGVGRDPQTLADQELAAAVRNQFGRYGDLSGYAPNIDVSARNGTVTLAGSVPGDMEKEMILAMVKNTPGVIGVNDMMRLTDPRISPTGRPTSEPGVYSNADDYFNLHVQGLSDTDRQLAQQILSDLRTDTVLASSVPKVNIYVADGQVTLRGIVQTEQQRQTIANTVQRAAGVNNVRNELRVQRLPR